MGRSIPAYDHIEAYQAQQRQLDLNYQDGQILKDEMKKAFENYKPSLKTLTHRKNDQFKEYKRKFEEDAALTQKFMNKGFPKTRAGTRNLTYDSEKVGTLQEIIKPPSSLKKQHNQ